MIKEDRIIEPLVSVLVTTYNRPHYLKEAIASAVKQTYRNLEIIVCDNCSDEDPQAVVKSFADPRIRFWRNDKNVGMLCNFLKAFEMARGQYIANLHDDDVWLENFLEKLIVPLSENPNLALAFCDHYVIGADSRIDEELTREYSQFYQRDRLKEGIYQPFYKEALVDKAVSWFSAAVIRRDVINTDCIPLDVVSSLDFYLNYLSCRDGLAAYYCPQKLTKYRQHENTDTMLTSKRGFQEKIKKARGEIFCYEQFIADDRLKDYHPYFEERLAYFTTSLGLGLMRAKNIKDARPYFWRSLEKKVSIRTIAALGLSFTHPQIAAMF